MTDALYGKVGRADAVTFELLLPPSATQPSNPDAAQSGAELTPEQRDVVESERLGRILAFEAATSNVLLRFYNGDIVDMRFEPIIGAM